MRSRIFCERAKHDKCDAVFLRFLNYSKCVPRITEKINSKNEPRTRTLAKQL